MKQQIEQARQETADDFFSKGDDISNLTPEERAERMRAFTQAMRNYRVELGNAMLIASPGLEKMH